MTTDGVSASLIFIKRNQVVSETMRHVDDANDDVKMKKKESDAESKPLVKTRSMDKLLLPLPPWSEYTILPLSFILFLFNLAGSH